MKGPSSLVLGVALLAVVFVPCLAKDPPYYILQCSKSDPKINECLTRTANHITQHIRRGIPELDLADAEPILIDEVSISLGSGPDAYRASFKDIEARGVSNMTVVRMRSNVDAIEFQMAIKIPKIRAKANYRSSGVLIVVKASGGGDYWGVYEGVRAVIDFAGEKYTGSDGETYVKVKKVKLDFAVDKISMGIENIHNGNTVIQAAMNLFINTNSQELLTEMKPSLKKKLEVVLHNFLDNKLLSKVPYDTGSNESIYQHEFTGATDGDETKFKEEIGSRSS
ncbi:hypothetical protein J437_LFUL015816 [Ladona fulva]|uniref:Protein takeout n=1 Tax=Ladona fulva TaxID=123851 RepID=A0A8K0KIM4_LADFU|nr:hypothetical protein J437_LFUL015816 [Ladona fulva]